MNVFFNEIGTKISSNIQTRTISHINPTTVSSTLSQFREISINDVLKIIGNLDLSCAKGYDSIPTSLLKNNSTKFAELLCNSINSCFHNNCFPNQMKIARITPIFKSGDKLDKTNYRPISVLPILSKPFERAIQSQLLSHFKCNKTINKNQFGFIEKSSTLSATLNLTEKIYNNLEHKKKTACIFIDLMKAFDCVQYDILLIKLQNYGIVGAAHELLKDYLSNRYQYVEINSIKSKKLKLISGVPQGSILGPILFTIYVNDIFNLNLSGEIQMFADDAVLVYGENNFLDLKKNMENDLKIINEWLELNNMRLNVKKTNFIIFQTSTIPNEGFCCVEFQNKQILRVQETCYLGLYIDTRLKWQKQINHIKSKIAPLIGVLRRVGYFINENVKNSIYNSYVLSSLLYLLPIWGAACNSRLDELEIVQKAALKSLYSQRTDHASLDLFSPNRLPIHKLKEYEFLLTIYKIENDMLKSNNVFVRNFNVSGRHTRNAKDFRLPKYSFNITRNSVFYGGFDIYNKLPSPIKRLKLKDFKIEIKKKLFNEYRNYYLSIH